MLPERNVAAQPHLRTTFGKDYPARDRAGSARSAGPLGPLDFDGYSDNVGGRQESSPQPREKSRHGKHNPQNLPKMHTPSTRRGFLQTLAAGALTPGLIRRVEGMERALAGPAGGGPFQPLSHHSVAALRGEYLLKDGLTYLNHASIGTIPRAVHEAHVSYLEQRTRAGQPAPFCGAAPTTSPSPTARPRASTYSPTAWSWGLATRCCTAR